MFLVVDDILIDSETPTVISSISKFIAPTGSSEVLIGDHSSASWVSYGGTYPPRFKSSTYTGARILPVDSEALVVTSSISKFVGPTLFFRGVYRGRVCMCTFIGASVRLCMS